MSGESFLATLEPGEWSIDAGRPGRGKHDGDISGQLCKLVLVESFGSHGYASALGVQPSTLPILLFGLRTHSTICLPSHHLLAPNQHVTFI